MESTSPIFNATLHEPTEQQRSAGVGKPQGREIPGDASFEYIQRTATELVDRALKENSRAILIGGLSSMGIAIDREARRRGLTVVEAKTERLQDEHGRFVFKEQGFRWVTSPDEPVSMIPTNDRPRSNPHFWGFIRQLNDDKFNWVNAGIVVLAIGVWLYLPQWFDHETVGAFWDVTEPVSGLATLAVLLVLWIANVLKNEELNREITITLRNERKPDEITTLPYQPLRAQLSRAELVGILGVYYGEPRFPPQPLHKVLNSEGGKPSELTRVIRGAADELVIDVTDEFFNRVRKNME